ncbi:MAG: hypothetical protein ACLRFM_01045 [Alphaproteobacteria bacterium]
MRKILCAMLGIIGLLFAVPAHATLPTGYTQLEYIESTGTQYIDLNTKTLLGTSNFQITTSVATTNYTSFGAIFGNKPDQGDADGFALYLNTTTLNRVLFSHNYPERPVDFSNFYDGNFHTINAVYNNNGTGLLKIDNQTFNLSDINTNTVDNNLNYCVFKNGDTFRFNGKMTTLTIMVENTNRYELVPAKRNSDGAIGMYDTVSGEFFGNSGTGTFIAGPIAEIKVATTKYVETQFSDLGTRLAAAVATVNTVVSNTITQAASIATLQSGKQTRPNDIADNNEKCPAGKKCLLVEGTDGQPHWYEIVESILQTDYTVLEYLRSDGSAYINTNYSPTSKTRIEIVAKVDSGAGNVNIVGSGHGTTGGVDGALLVINSLNDNTAEIKFNVSVPWVQVENVNMLEKNRLSLSATKFSVNGDVKATNDTTIPDTDNRPFYIFQRWRPSIASTNNKTQVYEFSIYENDILVRNMIPVKRNSDGVLGMYDLVGGRFYTNAGTGSFIAGPVAE